METWWASRSAARRLMMISLLAAFGIAGIYGCAPTPAEGKLQVFYTGSLRGSVSPCGCKVSKGGMARLTAFVNRNQEPDANWLMVDAGNFVDRSGTGQGCSAKCEFMLSSYDGLNFDVLNIARQEISLGYDALKTLREKTTHTKFVSGNLVDITSGKLLFDPYVIRDYGSIKVGVLGLLRDADFPANTSLLDSTKLKVTGTREAADRYLRELKGKVNSVVLLCELSTEDLDTIIAAHPEIDLVISSGPVRSGETMSKIGRTVIVGTGSSGYNGHYAMLEFNPTWGDSIACKPYQDALTDAYDEHSPIAEKLAVFEEQNGLPRRTLVNEGATPTPVTTTPPTSPSTAAHSLQAKAG